MRLLAATLVALVAPTAAAAALEVKLSVLPAEPKKGSRATIQLRPYWPYFTAARRWALRAPQWGPRYSRQYGARPRIHVTVHAG